MLLHAVFLIAVRGSGGDLNLVANEGSIICFSRAVV